MAEMMTSDHDLLIKLNENVSSLRTEMRQVVDQFTGQISDHEARLRLQEAASDRQEGALRATRWMLTAVSTALLALEIGAIWFHK